MFFNRKKNSKLIYNINYDSNKKNIDVINAHKFSSNHKNEILKDDICGCFYCIEIFNPKKVEEWVEDTNGTAICPFCGIDSVIGKSSGYPITKEFLSQMRQYWFSRKIL